MGKETTEISKRIIPFVLMKCILKMYNGSAMTGLVLRPCYQQIALSGVDRLIDRALPPPSFYVLSPKTLFVLI